VWREPVDERRERVEALELGGSASLEHRPGVAEGLARDDDRLEVVDLVGERDRLRIPGFVGKRSR
jgi:hypothetical protein